MLYARGNLVKILYSLLTMKMIERMLKGWNSHRKSESVTVAVASKFSFKMSQHNEGWSEWIWKS